MPIYEYQCGACGYKLEVLQKISDDPLQECTECGEESLRKLISAVAFRLKGSGWYETDFKDDKSRKNLANTDEKPADKDAGKDKKDASGADSSKAESKSTATNDNASKAGKSSEKKVKAQPSTRQ